MAGDQSITVTWEAPADDGGSPITAYEVISDNDVYYSPMRVAADQRSVILRGLINGLRYRPYVRAVNAQGLGLTRWADDSVVPGTVPSAPPNLSVMSRPDGAVRVSWTPAYPNGATVTQYTLTADPSGATGSIDTPSWDAAPPNPDGAGYYWLDLRGLRTGATHSVAVTATNRVGSSTASTLTFDLDVSDALMADGLLGPGDMLLSENEHYALVMQEDGNVVEYGPTGALWASGTGVAGTVLVMQRDGNMVAYAPGGRAVWDSHTGTSPGAAAVMQDDGNLVIYRTNGSPIWASRSANTRPLVNDSLPTGGQLTRGQQLVSADRTHTLVMQGDGNLVVYGPTGPVWATGRVGSALVMQGDGNLVVYGAGGQPVWAAGVGGFAGGTVVMQNDGNLVVYRPGGTPAWASRGR